MKVGGWFELLFVNGLGMSFNSGVVVYIILLAAALIWGVYESYTEKNKTRMAISFILTIALLGIPFPILPKIQYAASGYIRFL